MHPAKEGYAALPFFDEFDLSTVDIVLISQYVTLSFVSRLLFLWCTHGPREEKRLCCRARGVGFMLSLTMWNPLLNKPRPNLLHVDQKNQCKLFELSSSVQLRTHLYSHGCHRLLRHSLCPASYCCY